MNKAKNIKYIYFVEGPCEQKIVDTLKEKEQEYIVSGKALKFNIAQENIKKSHLMSLTENTVAILIFDNDVLNDSTINQQQLQKRILDNISKLKSACKEVIVICQKENLEDEILRATNLKQIKDILNSKSNTDWKRDMQNTTNLMQKLLNKNFDINKFWCGELPKFIKNVKTSDEIKLK